MIQIFISNVN